MAAPPKHTLQLHSGSHMPVFGLGTWKSKTGEVHKAVEYALSIGYNHIDCALVYNNEGEIGSAISNALEKKIIERKDLWITSKLWNTFHDPQHVRQSFLTTLANLKLDYLDLYLIHWPYAFQFSGYENENLFPKNEDGTVKYSDTDYLDTWKALEHLVDEGLIKNIGLSNFNSEQIQRVWDNSRIKPSVLQVELHPYLPQEKLIRFAKEKNIAVTAYSPLGSPDRPWAESADPSVLEDPLVKALAEKYKKTPGQILIRFPIDRGISVVPKSVTPSRIESNKQVFDFHLEKEDVDALIALNKNYRYCGLSRDKVHKHYPFHIEF
jgi:aldehyde reductase